MLLVGVPASIFLEGKLRDWTRDQVVDELATNARSMHVALRNYEKSALQAAAIEYSRALALRVTLISPDGAVLGDSSVPSERIPTVDNHGDRPEIVTAQADGLGVAQRLSTTINTQLLYTAVAEPGLTVRLATPLTRVDDAVYRLRVI